MDMEPDLALLFMLFDLYLLMRMIFLLYILPLLISLAVDVASSSIVRLLYTQMSLSKVRSKVIARLVPLGVWVRSNNRGTLVSN